MASPKMMEFDRLMSRPIGVLISDIHFNMNTLDLAREALLGAVKKANDLEVDLFILGDMHDTKANIRSECLRMILNCLYGVEKTVHYLRGNHDSESEKCGLNSLDILGTIDNINCVESYQRVEFDNGLPPVNLIAYCSEADAARELLNIIPHGEIVLMHQGLIGSQSGEYYQDKSAITIDDVKNHRVISGHYHCRQAIKTGPKMQFDYLGNPFTLNFGEAGDPPKGFQVLYDNRQLDFIPTDLPKHVVFNLTAKDIGPQTVLVYEPMDKLLLKITGTREELAQLDRQSILHRLMIKSDNVRIDFSATDTNAAATEASGSTDTEIIDNLVEKAQISDPQKARLKKLWRDKA